MRGATERRYAHPSKRREVPTGSSAGDCGALKKTSAGQFRSNLKAGNGEIIAPSARYRSKESALNGIQSVKDNAAGAAGAAVDEQTD
jgi:hypothetical protein